MSIVTVSMISFGVVILTLSILAVVIRIIATLFPQSEPEVSVIEPIMVQVVSQAVNSFLPGATVAKIEEIKPGKKLHHP